jgi:hypothetical protein
MFAPPLPVSVSLKAEPLMFSKFWKTSPAACPPEAAPVPKLIVTPALEAA